MINGRVFDWESIRVDAPWGLDAEILSISYNAESPVEEQYGRGRTANGYGQGNLVQAGSIEVDARGWLALTAFALTNGGLFNIPPFPISVSYGNSDQIPQTDFLPNVKIEQTETEANQGDMRIKTHSMNIKILNPIQFNTVPVL